jgi:hypothetical protein
VQKRNENGFVNKGMQKITLNLVFGASPEALGTKVVGRKSNIDGITLCVPIGIRQIPASRTCFAANYSMMIWEGCGQWSPYEKHNPVRRRSIPAEFPSQTSPNLPKLRHRSPPNPFYIVPRDDRGKHFLLSSLPQLTAICPVQN